MASSTYTPYQNKRSLFQNDLHLKKRAELTGVALTPIDKIFYKGEQQMSYLEYLKQLKGDEKAIKDSPNLKMLSTRKARTLNKTMPMTKMVGLMAQNTPRKQVTISRVHIDDKKQEPGSPKTRLSTT